MRILITAGSVAAAGLIAAGTLGVADAETTAVPSPAPTRTVSVQGVAIEPIDQDASATSATTVYRQGMADAINDAQAKAQFLAGKAGAALGAVQDIAEGGGYIECAGEAEYLGVQPDFGSSSVRGAVAPEAAAVKTPSHPASTVHKPAAKHTKKKQHYKRVKAKKATAPNASCTLSTQVALVYALS
jgi:hypothetical protein